MNRLVVFANTCGSSFVVPLMRIQGPSPVQRMKCTLWKLPKYLVLAVKRFSKNNFFIEKNPTIVTFPVKNLDLRECERENATASILLASFQQNELREA